MCKSSSTSAIPSARTCACTVRSTGQNWWKILTFRNLSDILCRVLVRWRSYELHEFNSGVQVPFGPTKAKQFHAGLHKLI